MRRLDMRLVCIECRIAPIAATRPLTAVIKVTI
jgi:hypothetical protein